MNRFEHTLMFYYTVNVYNKKLYLLILFYNGVVIYKMSRKCQHKITDGNRKGQNCDKYTNSQWYYYTIL